MYSPFASNLTKQLIMSHSCADFHEFIFLQFFPHFVRLAFSRIDCMFYLISNENFDQQKWNFVFSIFTETSNFCSKFVPLTRKFYVRMGWRWLGRVQLSLLNSILRENAYFVKWFMCAFSSQEAAGGRVQAKNVDGTLSSTACIGNRAVAVIDIRIVFLDVEHFVSTGRPVYILPQTAALITLLSPIFKED